MFRETIAISVAILSTDEETFHAFLVIFLSHTRNGVSRWHLVIIRHRSLFGRFSLAVPFLPQPAALDGSMIGDVGFDPLGFATPENIHR